MKANIYKKIILVVFSDLIVFEWGGVGGGMDQTNRIGYKNKNRISYYFICLFKIIFVFFLVGGADR